MNVRFILCPSHFNAGGNNLLYVLDNVLCFNLLYLLDNVLCFNLLYVLDNVLCFNLLYVLDNVLCFNVLCFNLLYVLDTVLCFNLLYVLDNVLCFWLLGEKRNLMAVLGIQLCYLGHSACVTQTRSPVTAQNASTSSHDSLENLKKF